MTSITLNGNYPDSWNAQLLTVIDNTTPNPVIQLKVGDSRVLYNEAAADGVKTLVTEYVVNFATSSGVPDLVSETMVLGSCALAAGQTDILQCTVGTRGIPNGTKAINSAVAVATLYRAHKKGARMVLNEIPLLKGLEDTFQAGSAQSSIYTAGETIADRDSVSTHSDNKIYKYHKTNYPKLYGISNGAYAVDATVTVIRNGGAKTGFTGLILGDLVYAENTGAITQTVSTTTKIVGSADSDTIVRVGLATNDLQPASAAEITAQAGTGVPNVTQAAELIGVLSGSIVTYTLPLPVIYTTALTSSTINNDTTAKFSMFNMGDKITANKLIFTVPSHSATGTFDINIYSEDGQTIILSQTTPSIASSGNHVITLDAPVVISAGNYYIGIVSNDASVNMSLLTYATQAWLHNVSGYPVLSGTKTVTTGTLPSTIDPTSDITYVANSALFFALAN
tara:strand:+ start:725 stop:2080 length:1356 start_codon:yes stop_codon:yes gene_type:complete